MDRVVDVDVEADRPGRVGAADPAPSVVVDELVALGQGWVAQQRGEAVGEHGTDEQHGLSGPGDLVLEVDVVDVGGLHGRSPGRCGCQTKVVPSRLRRELGLYGRNVGCYGVES
jgi:hypothetical protein